MSKLLWCMQIEGKSNAKARYRGIKKNAAQLTMLFAFANLLKVKKQLLAQMA